MKDHPFFAEMDRIYGLNRFRWEPPFAKQSIEIWGHLFLEGTTLAWEYRVEYLAWTCTARLERDGFVAVTSTRIDRRDIESGMSIQPHIEKLADKHAKAYRDAREDQVEPPPPTTIERLAVFVHRLAERVEAFTERLRRYVLGRSEG